MRGSTALWLSSLTLALLVCAGSGTARAQRGVDIHLFHPNIDGNGFFAVERSETLPSLSLSARLTVDYAHQPLSLAMTDPTTMMARRQTMMDWQLVGHLGIAVGIVHWLEALVEFPVSAQGYSQAYGRPLRFDDPSLTRTGFYQSDPYTTVAPPDASPLDLRLGFKARFWHNRWVGFGAIALMTAPLGDSGHFLGEKNVTFRPTLVGDLTVGRFGAALNVGAVVRETIRVLDPYQVAAHAAAPRVLLEAGHELTWSGALGYRVLPWMGIVAEIVWLEPLVVSRDAFRDRTIDLQGGFQFFASSRLQVIVGAGGNLPTDAARHELFRVFVGIGGALIGARGVERGGGAGIPLPVATNGDRDGDGIPDDRDKCPDDPEDRDGFQDEDGCPDIDNDQDGLPDAVDRCPNDPEDRDGFEDQDGCPDLDNDGDDIPDAVDRCPNEAETRNGIDDADGCPDSGGVAPADVVVLPQIAFDAGKSALSKAAETALDRVADKLQAIPGLRRVRLEGHADAKEPARPNAAALSTTRALTVRQYLIKRGVDPSRLQAVGYGAGRPHDSADTPAAHASNRRVELIVVEQ